MKNKSIFFCLMIVFGLFLACEEPNKEDKSEPTPTPKYMVQFEANGGEPSPENQIINEGGKVDMPASMTKTGHGFGGWYKESSLINEWDFAVDTVTENISLFANMGHQLSYGKF